MKNIQPPRGTHDLIGEEALLYEKIHKVFSDYAKRFNFKYIETPIFESLSVFDRTLGEASDIVSKEMYVFEDRGGEKLSLRPEGTASIVRAFLSNGLQRSLPLKLYYSGPMFRYERPQKGRYRQFRQFGVEFLGADDLYSDIEVIQLASDFLKALNLKGKTTLHINSLGSDECRNKYRQELVSYYNAKEASLSEDSQKRLKTNPLRILDSKDESDIEINKSAPVLYDFLSSNSKARLDAALESMKLLGIEYQLDHRLVRGLDYYNNIVFEFKTDALGAQDAVLAGGRYNKLVADMGGPDTPGIGFATGAERLMMLADLKEEQPGAIAIAPLDDSAGQAALVLAKELRGAGVPVQFVTSGNMSKRLKKANGFNARGIFLIGDNEVQSETFNYKDFKSSSETTLKLSDIKKHFS